MGYLLRTTAEWKPICPAGDTFTECELRMAVAGAYDVLPLMLPERLSIVGLGTALCLIFRKGGEEGDEPVNRIASSLAQGRHIYGPVVLCLPSELIRQPPTWGS